MTFYDRYINGEDGRAIYSEIYALNTEAFSEKHFVDIHNVLTETFKRVAFNLEIIFSELKRLNYGFRTDFEINSDKPLVKPLSNTDSLLKQLDDAVKDFGHVPYSLQLFYKIVGACNFAWDYETQPELFWHCADPIQICSLDDLVIEVSDADWKDYQNEIIAEGYAESAELELAADYLHKDNISGGLAYSILLSKEKCIDAAFLNESHETSFINYLRVCMENCGFSKIAVPEYGNDYADFFARLKPQLKKI